MHELNDESNPYVCVTHHTFWPCTKGDRHLLSNWASDVKKIISIMEKKI